MKSTAKKDWIVVLLIGLHVVFLLVFVFMRLVDHDEGVYLMAAWQVAEGKTVYIDFFYPQMPYLPYFLSVLSGHGFTTLYLGRIVSAMLSVLSALVLYVLLRQVTLDRRTIAAALFLYAVSGFVITWHSVVRTYASTDFFLLLFCYFLFRFKDTQRMLPAVLAGILLALALNIRLVFAPVILVGAIYVVFVGNKSRAASVSAFVGSFLAASLPSLFIFVRSPRRFLFDNLGFHLLRNLDNEFSYIIVDKMLTLVKLMINPQIAIILLAVIGTVVIGKRSQERFSGRRPASSKTGLAGAIAIVIVVAYLLLHPVHQQYFSQAIPFVLLASTRGIQHFLNRSSAVWPFVSNRTLRGILMAVYILGIIPYMVVFIGGVRHVDGSHTLCNVKAICSCVQEIGGAGPVFSVWPVIPVLSQLPVIEGQECAGHDFPVQLTAEQKRYYHTPTNDDLRQIIQQSRATALVLKDGPDRALADVVADNYELRKTFGRYQVYQRKTN